MSDSTDSPSLVLQGISPPLRWADFRIAAFDMDSTLINIECIDEIAAVAGVSRQVVERIRNRRPRKPGY